MIPNFSSRVYIFSEKYSQCSLLKKLIRITMQSFVEKKIFKQAIFVNGKKNKIRSF